MEKDYLKVSENAEEDSKEPQHQSSKQFRVRKKQMYIKLLNQMEFYFSNSNLSKDRFMAKMIAEDPFVPLSKFLTFNKIAQILKCYAVTEEEKQQHELAKSVSKSTMLELSEDKTKIRVRDDIPKKSPEEIDNCTIYVEQIPLSSTHDSLKLIFSKYGKINYISLPRYKKSRQIKQFCFIEFDDPASVQNVLTAFKRLDGVLQYTAVKPETLLSITTFEKDDTDEPPTKRIKLDTEEVDEKGDEKETAVPETTENVETDTKNEEEEEEKAPEEGTEEAATPKKKKRKHKRRNTAKNKTLDEHVMAMKVMKKNDWKKLRNAYLNLERQKAKEIKKILRESYNKRNENKIQPFSQTKASPKISFYGSPNDRSSENATDAVTESIFESYQTGNIQYTPGCIVNIKFREPCEPKEFKKELKQFPNVQYVDIMEGGSQCFIRVNASQSAHELVSHYSSCEYETEILKDELERDYWKKIFDSRERKKKNEDSKTKPATTEKRHRRRGREKLMDKISKVTQNQIIRFSDVEEHAE